MESHPVALSAQERVLCCLAEQIDDKARYFVMGADLFGSLAETIRKVPFFKRVESFRTLKNDDCSSVWQRFLFTVGKAFCSCSLGTVWILFSLDRCGCYIDSHLRKWRFFLNRRSLPVPCHEFWTRSSSADDSMPGEFCSELLNRFSSFVSPSFVPRSEPAASCGDSSSTGSGRARCKRYRVLPGRHGQQ